MLKKLFAWVKGLFVQVPIEETRVDEFISAQKRRQQKDDNTTLQVNVKGNSKPSVKVSKPGLDQQLAEVELPAYAKGRVLPPKAKRQFIERSRAQAKPAASSGFSSSHSSSHVNNTSSTDALTAGVVGYAIGNSYNDSSSSSNHTTSHSSHSSGYDSCSSSSSYDSSSYDSGSSYSSCD